MKTKQTSQKWITGLIAAVALALPALSQGGPYRLRLAVTELDGKPEAGIADESST